MRRVTRGPWSSRSRYNALPGCVGHSRRKERHPSSVGMSSESDSEPYARWAYRPCVDARGAGIVIWARGSRRQRSINVQVLGFQDVEARTVD